MYTFRHEGEPIEPRTREEWRLSPTRFLTPDDVSRLRKAARARMRGRAWRRARVLEWFTLEVALHTGLRVGEIVALSCGDVALDGDLPYVHVRRGKGGRSRIVRVGPEFVQVADEFLAWRASPETPPPSDAPLLAGRKGNYLHKRSIQAMIARLYRAAGIEGHRAHDLRHTYASHLLRASQWNLRLVQKQLGHASIRTTEVYADILDPDLTAALERLYMDPPAPRTVRTRKRRRQGPKSTEAHGARSATATPDSKPVPDSQPAEADDSSCVGSGHKPDKTAPRVEFDQTRADRGVRQDGR